MSGSSTCNSYNSGSLYEPVKRYRPRTLEAYPTTNIRKSMLYNVAHPNYKKVKGYRSERNNPRIGIAINFFRYKVRLSINKISKILGVSTRTVHRKISFSRLAGGLAFDGAHRRFRKFTEVKIRNSKGLIISLKTLVFRACLYIIGSLRYPEEILGEKPP